MKKGKPLSDLSEMETDLPKGHDGLKIRDQQFDKWIAMVRTMEDTPMYEFAWGTIVDIRLTCEKLGYATAGQQQAIQNIRAGAQRHEDAREGWKRHEKRTGRRYEGWNPSD